MIKLLLKENDIPSLTSFSGNIDADALKPYVYLAQTIELKRILGLDLYNKIYDDYTGNTLAGEYLKLYNEYILEMLVYYSCFRYASFGSYKITNNGVHKPNVDGGQLPDVKELNTLIASYKELASSKETSFHEYMETIDIPEYQTDTDRTDTNKIIPWY